MPRAPKSTTPMKTKKRNYKRRYQLIKRKPNNDLASSGLPLKRLVKFKYVQTVNLGNGTTSTASHHMSTNSLFDPDVTSGGHQPMSFDQWTLLYKTYRVLGSKINVRFLAKQGTQNVIVGVAPTNDIDAALDFPTMLERPGSYGKVLTTQFPTYVTRKWSLKRVRNANDEAYSGQLGNTSLSGGTNPANQDYYRIWAANPDSTAAIASNSVSCIVEITYIAELSDRLLLESS